MFNLITGIDCVDGRQSFLLSRIYSGDLEKPSSIQDFEERSRLPTVIIDEGAPTTDGVARFAKLSDFGIDGKEVSFDLRLESDAYSFPASLLDTVKSKHSLNDHYRWHHTCWQYGEGNIFESVYRYGHREMIENQPKVFKLRVPPKIDMKVVACMMPFASEFDDVYTSIQSACTECGLECLRVDEIYNNGPIIDDVIDVIDRAAVVVCDLTGKNPNVLYETGVSHALGREVVILAQDIATDVPFDLRHVRCIQYDGKNQNGRDKLKATLSKTIEAVRKK